jgi:hypothetical protein
MVNHADDQGRIKANPAYLRSIIFPYDDVSLADIEGWLDELAANGTILIYTVDRKTYAQFLNWWEYQRMNFAAPSQYLAPDGWCDRIRYNAKGGKVLYYNWLATDGRRLTDTCDASGQPLVDAPKIHMAVHMDTPNGSPKGGINKDKDKDKDKDKEQRGATPSPRHAPKSDAVEFFRQQHNRYPNDLQITAIDEQVTDLAIWQRAVLAWKMAGHNPTRVDGMLDWYHYPERMNRNGTIQPRPGPSSFAQQSVNAVHAVFDHMETSHEPTHDSTQTVRQLPAHTGHTGNGAGLPGTVAARPHAGTGRGGGQVH